MADHSPAELEQDSDLEMNHEAAYEACSNAAKGATIHPVVLGWTGSQSQRQ